MQTEMNSTVSEHQIRMDNGHYQQRQLIAMAKIKQWCWLIPATAACLTPVMIALPYLISVCKKQIEIFFPTVSDGGAAGTPSTYVFPMLLDCIVILGFVTIWLRFKQVDYYINNQLNSQGPSSSDGRPQDDTWTWDAADRLHQYNGISTVALAIFAMGAIIVGNVRSTENILVHIFGGVSLVGIGFLTGMLYSVRLWAALARMGIESPPTTLRANLWFALLTGTIAAITLAVTIVKCGLNTYADNHFRLFYPRDHAGYWWHIIASIFEWVFLFTIIVLFVCLANRFKQFPHWNQMQF